MVRPINQNLRVNEQIRISPVRLIGDNNEQLGIVPTHDAMRMAREAGLDLVEVAPNVRPPVCRLMNYGRWKYTQKKNVKKHHELQLKEVRMRPRTDTNDRNIKMRQAMRFLADGHKVQFTMVFRGREQAHREIGMAAFREVLDALATRVKVERPPGMEGRHMVMILSAVKGAFPELEKESGASSRPAGELPETAADDTATLIGPDLAAEVAPEPEPTAEATQSEIAG